MDVDPLYARYPFFEGARDAVSEADVSLSELVESEAPAVDRGFERVERGLIEGTVASETPRAWSLADELLSYPIARVLVSLVDAPAAIEKYATAEATTAHERFTEDFAAVAEDRSLRSVTDDRITRQQFLREFDMEESVSPEQPAGSEWFWIDVPTYLRLVDDWGESWLLVTREVRSGRVRVDSEELYRLLQEAVRLRVAEGLPFDVTASPGGDRIADALDPAVEDVRDLLSDRDDVGDIDTVVPELFPPCMTRLLERARRGAELEPHASFALLAFLLGIGMSTDEIVTFCEATSLDPEAIRYQTEYLRDDRGVQYPPPSCETLHTYGLCENEDDHWDVAGHPLVYYQRMLERADDDELEDWRDRETPSEP